MPLRLHLAILGLFAPPIAFGCLFASLISGQSQTEVILPEIQPRTITMSTLALEGIGLPEQECLAANTLAVIDHRVAYPVSDPMGNGLAIRLRDLFGGSVAWLTEETPRPHAMLASDTELFVTSSLEARAYSLNSGALLWQRQVLPGHTANSILPDLGSGLTIYYTQQSWGKHTAFILRLDPATGATIESEHFPLPQYAAMVPSPNLHYLWLSGNSLWLAPPPPAPEEWHVDTGDSIPGIAMWPVQYQQTTILSPGLYPRIIAVDSASGEAIWEDGREFASLPILFRGTLYALTKDAALVTLDPTSGLELARAQFSPSRTEDTTRTHIYALSASDEVLGVYFGDSCQMFVFSPPGA